MKVLIIDDSPDALRLAQHHLVPEGLEVRCADSGKAGLEMATREGPDLILLDVDMPGLSGLDVCRVLKDDAKLCMVPVIFLSGSGGPDDKIAGLDLGAVDYVTKPFDAFELRARVRSALRTKRLQDLLRDYALVDPLTELPNRRALDERLRQEWARLLRHGGHLSVIMADLDHFKQINDRCGHLVGDETLRQVARRLFEGCRQSDMACRYGGEEFVIIAPEAPLDAAVEFADRLRSAVGSRPLQIDGQAVEVTASFGVAGHEGRNSPEEMIQAADEALYQAKEAGRNRVQAAKPVVSLATTR